MTDSYSPPFEIENKTANIFNLENFRRYIIENGVVDTAIGYSMGKHIGNITESLFNNLVLPFFNKDSDGDGVSDFKSFEDYKKNIFGIEFKIGKFILDLVKFLLMIYCMFIIARLTRDIIN
jgi:large-conductance mechanosensitive channel